ncbi:hypothetical protein ACQFYA_18375 [Promicromonospora sp. Marseille-Q5078]
MIEILGDVFGWIVGNRWGRRVVERRNERFRADNKTEAAVRLVYGSVRGLTGQWMPAVWSIAPGRLSNFSVVVTVGALTRDESRRPGNRESLSVDPDAEIYQARSNDAVVEVALLPSQSAWVVAVLQGEQPS